MKRKILVAAVVVVIAAAATYAFTRGFDSQRFIESLWKVSPWWLTASVVVSLATYLGRAYRWRVLLRPVKEVGIRPLFEATLVGFSTIYILGRAGELARPVWLMRREKVPFSASVATLVAERFLDMISLIGVFAWALLTVEVPAESAQTFHLMKSGAWMALAGSVGGLLALIAFSWYPALALRLVPFAWAKPLAKSFVEGLTSLGNVRSLAASLAYSTMIWIGILWQFWFLLLSMNFKLSAAAATVVLVGTAIGSLAQIPGIGGGFQAAFMFCLATFFSVAKEDALAAALVAWVSSYVPTIVVTAAYLALSGVQMRDLKTALRREEEGTGMGMGTGI